MLCPETEDFTVMKKQNTLLYKGRKRFPRLVFGRSAVVIFLLVLQFFMIFAVFAEFEKYLVAAYGGMTLVGLVMAVYISGKKGNPAVKLSWTVLMILTPVFGTLLYIFIHTEIGHRILNRKLNTVLESTDSLLYRNSAVSENAKNESKWLYNLSEYTFSNGHYPIYPNHSTEYYPSGEEMFESLKTALMTAKEFIFLEFFIIEEGEMWNSILEILKQKAKEGVEVRVMYDGTCQFSLLPHSYGKKLGSFGIKCRVFAPLLPFVSTHYNNRDHRKIVVIDGKTAFTGGVNLADEYINKKERFGHWKDTGIKITGEAVDSFTVMFLQMWNIRDTKEDFSLYLRKTVYSSLVEKDGFIIPYGDSPLDDERLGENIYMDIINTALDYVYISTPYLILDGEMTTALTNAAKRGVDVRIVIPHIPDHKIAFAIAQSHYFDLIPSGVKIYEYTPGFIHSKVMLSDGKKAVTGTINLDYRSLYLHFECAAFLYGVSTISDIEKDFDDTFEKSREVLDSDLKGKGFFGTLYHGVLRLIAPLM